VFIRAFGGSDATNSCPVDRRKKGSKHTLLVDRYGVSLAIQTAGANVSDHRQIIPVVLDFPASGASPAAPRNCPMSCTRTAGTTARRPGAS
jgi:hypothetical protein